ncbi:MAG: bifunctional nuclease family protein [Candidatus Omnitrophota bacterium]
MPLFPLPQFVVILEDTEKTHLVPIWIGLTEGNAIAMELQGEKFPRPLTHDLMAQMITVLGVTLERVIISDLKDSSYYATIELRLGERLIALDARPSDSLALAVRMHCPIFVDEKVLAKCPLIGHGITQEDADKFKNDLKTMSPEEFFKNLEASPSAEEQGIVGDFENPADEDAGPEFGGPPREGPDEPDKEGR